MTRLTQHELRLHADPTRVVVRPFHLAWQASGPDLERVQRLAREIIALDARTVRAELAVVLRDFADRHRQIEQVFQDRFDEIEPRLGLEAPLRRETELLIGAYFCHEYSYAAAAVMNPSVVHHPDQSGLEPGSIRIVLSFRAVGEGHISTIAFREGVITAQRGMTLVPQPPFATAAMAGPATDPITNDSVTLHRQPDSSLSGTVIFPITEAQRNGLEDLRLVEFEGEDGDIEWIGTYTAYSGRDIRSELLRTHDFRDFTLAPIKGGAGRNKGMALFPRKIDGRYCMIGRQDGKNLYLLRSDSLDHWEGGELLLEPRYPWELVQIGNCGAPIELDEGWLVLTHGVGAMRKYAIGAMLLDKADPSKVLGRTPNPILSAADEDREGYVPNVVYTCGAIRVGDDIFLPYGVADSSVCFAFLAIADILMAMDTVAV
ncbi:glycoside hydrolase family 130 protein [Sphingomonas sp. 35-24ZXX]|uniref:glycoside hydrolase family 130 protein n=1 Tax=Sphingomonas sp. 35-24ZXX TaxID=1545915 RepID=UPI00068A7B8C|nr:glycoside hydrolase family 130 protein [Sphingomonas sp. 35-24ZXX]